MSLARHLGLRFVSLIYCSEDLCESASCVPEFIYGCSMVSTMQSLLAGYGSELSRGFSSSGIIGSFSIKFLSVSGF